VPHPLDGGAARVIVGSAPMGMGSRGTHPWWNRGATPALTKESRRCAS